MGKFDSASQAYLKAAQLLGEKGDITWAVAALENVLRIQPRDKDLARLLFTQLCEVNLATRGIDYLKSVGLDLDPDFKVLIGDALVRQGALESVKAMLLEGGGIQPKTLCRYHEATARIDRQKRFERRAGRGEGRL